MLTTKTSVDQWTVEDVRHWLDISGFSRYVELFASVHQIDGAALLLLTGEDLKLMGMANVVGDFKRFQIALDWLKSNRDNATSFRESKITRHRRGRNGLECPDCHAKLFGDYFKEHVFGRHNRPPKCPNRPVRPYNVEEYKSILKTAQCQYRLDLVASHQREVGANNNVRPLDNALPKLEERTKDESKIQGWSPIREALPHFERYLSEAWFGKIVTANSTVRTRVSIVQSVFTRCGFRCVADAVIDVPLVLRALAGQFGAMKRYGNRSATVYALRHFYKFIRQTCSDLKMKESAKRLFLQLDDARLNYNKGRMAEQMERRRDWLRNANRHITSRDMSTFLHFLELKVDKICSVIQQKQEVGSVEHFNVSDAEYDAVVVYLCVSLCVRCGIRPGSFYEIQVSEIQQVRPGKNSHLVLVSRCKASSSNDGWLSFSPKQWEIIQLYGSKLRPNPIGDAADSNVFFLTRSGRKFASILRKTKNLWSEHYDSLQVRPEDRKVFNFQRWRVSLTTEALRQMPAEKAPKLRPLLNGLLGHSEAVAKTYYEMAHAAEEHEDIAEFVASLGNDRL